MARRAGISDLVLPTAVVAVVAMMIFPLPTGVLDVLLMCNVTFSLVLLISAVYISEPEKFTALPSILLLTTLFRLGLNISTTRVLLGEGEAPQIVKAFGSFVVSGNLIVGAVVFVIVTLVQFLVIAKGAERVAEVAARFTLDAMPGKQMSIDADVRAGIIGLEEARRKRRELHRESKLFGALDGAMKFVKGDAIAGLIITLINISAGLLLGVFQQGLSFSMAVQKYTLFTIGDGLVSQIPALLVAVSAGIAVTRVEDLDGSFVGRDVFTQISKEPQAIATAGIVLLVLSTVPALPSLPFLGMGIILIVASRTGAKRKRTEERNATQLEFRPKVLSPVVLRLSPQATILLQKEKELPRYLQTLRSEIFEKSGVIVPDVQFELDRLTDGTVAGFYLNGVKRFSVHYETETKETFSKGVTQRCSEFLATHLHELIDDTQTRMLLEVHQAVAEDLVNNIIPNIVSVTALTTVLRGLILEGVSIREIRVILQAIAESHLETKEGSPTVPTLPTVSASLLSHLKALQQEGSKVPTRSRELLAEVRVKLARTISEQVSDPDWRVRAWLAEPALDHLLARIAFAAAPIEPDLVDNLVSAIQRSIGFDVRKEAVILCSRYARSTLAGLIRSDFPRCRVIAFEELCAEAKVEVLGSVTLRSTTTELEEELDEMKTKDNVIYLTREAA